MILTPKKEKEHILGNKEQRISDIFAELCTRKVKNEQNGIRTEWK
jgi:hypothetical protein